MHNSLHASNLCASVRPGNSFSSRGLSKLAVLVGWSCRKLFSLHEHQSCIKRNVSSVQTWDGEYGQLLLMQVIIIPIYWKKRDAEMQQVLALAGSVMQLLKQNSISASLDTDESRTPGQKYKLWEERKVRVRIEIGPKDAAARQCVLAHASASPGQLAAKQTHKVCPSLW